MALSSQEGTLNPTYLLVIKVPHQLKLDLQLGPASAPQVAEKELAPWMTSPGNASQALATGRDSPGQCSAGTSTGFIALSV